MGEGALNLALKEGREHSGHKARRARADHQELRVAQPGWSGDQEGACGAWAETGHLSLLMGTGGQPKD